MYPVPCATTSSSMETMMRAVRESRTWVRSGCGSQSTSPSRLTTLRTGWGRTRVPSVAKVAYASANWMGTTSAAPMAVDANRSTSVRSPMRWAVCATVSSPTSSPSLMAIMLTDRRRPSRMVIGPRNSSVKLGASTPPHYLGRTTGASTMMWDAGIPLANAEV